MAKGSFLVAREAARMMTAQGIGGDLVYVVSKNAVVAGPDNLAYGAAKADQAHQVRLLAAELGQHQIRVNGVNPDAVVRGSGIFAGGWGAQRAAVYGVAEEELAAFYAKRTLLGARGAAGARRGRGVRPGRRRPRPHHRAADPGRRRGRGSLPAIIPGHLEVPSTAKGGGITQADSYAAVDLGASSGRVMVARGGAVTDRAARGAPLPQRPRPPPRRAALGRPAAVPRHLGRAAGRRRRPDGIASVGVDSWGVDFGLLDAVGALVGNPYHYRDGRTDGMVEKVAARIPPETSYSLTGVQVLPFNTVYQLAAAAGTPQLETARTLLLIPDLIGYWLTGLAGAEATNASTTGLLDVNGGGWSAEVLDAVGIPPELLPPLRRPGEVVGPLLGEVVAETGLPPSAVRSPRSDRTTPPPRWSASPPTASASPTSPAAPGRWSASSWTRRC